MKRKKYPHKPGFVKGSDTSKAAADKVEPDAPSMRDVILSLFTQDRCDSGYTDDELEQMTGWRHQTVSARRRELELMGKVAKTRERRETRSFSTAAVYKVVRDDGEA